MTGDHFNLNSNAPEYNEVIPLNDVDKFEVTPWLYLCERKYLHYFITIF